MTTSNTTAARGDMARHLKLLTYLQAKEKIIETVGGRRTRVESVPIDSALGRVSAEEVVSPCDVPAFSTSAMDGYAIKSCEVAKADASHPAVFKVMGSVYAGSPKPASRVTGRLTYYVATGAPVPDGADAVVKVEETRLKGEEVSMSGSIPTGKNVAARGEDIGAGDVVLSKGAMVNPAQIALLVSAGRTELAVFAKPKVGILSTGDELSLPGSSEEGKKTNNYSNLLAGYLADAGAAPVPLGVAKDDAEEILGMVEKNISNLDAVITIGGSSVGQKDFTPSALKGATDFVEVFHGIRMVPVRPTGLATLGGKPVVLVPGHAVAAALSFFLVVRPMVNLLSGLAYDAGIPTIRARLSEELANRRPIGAIFLTKLSVKDGSYEAEPLRWGSNLVSSLTSANGYFPVAPRKTLEAGQEVVVNLLGAQEMYRIPRGGAR